jgi:hypothetical protein
MSPAVKKIFANRSSRWWGCLNLAATALTVGITTFLTHGSAAGLLCK